MFFSVIIPTYDRRQLLRIAVDSVLQQTDRDFELIVVDDGSGDNSYDELSLLKSQFSNFRILRQENRGVAAARNAGIEAAQGEWLCFLDSDDRFRRDKLTVTRSYIERFADIKVFHTDEVWYRNGAFLPQKKIHAKADGDAFMPSLEMCRISPSSVCIHRSVFDDIGLFDESFPVCEDYELWLRLTLRYPVKLVPEPLTIKEGGRPDQLSARTGMDEYRALALEKLLACAPLTPEQRRAVEQTRDTKRKIFLDGCRKRELSLESAFNIRLNDNNRRELDRLIHEIVQRDGCRSDSVIAAICDRLGHSRSTGKDRIRKIKHILLALRFPQTYAAGVLREQDVYLPLLQPSQVIRHPAATFTPERIFVERAAAGSDIEQRLRSTFADIPVDTLERYTDALKNHAATPSSLKAPFVFIVKEHADFLKPCPCTKNHIGCGYWILNLGFGCPFDCSYCYLQQYQNVPGVVLPANINDFLDTFDDWHRRMNNRLIRIGTGEFCDSLALDHLTGYTKKLVPFFSRRNVLFELKTKSANIENLLEMKAAENIVIGFSLNPQPLIEREEIGVASLAQRLDAARRLKAHGYTVAFHFDPVVPAQGWEQKYKETIRELYDTVPSPYRWISIGTLRFTRELKTFIEQRFPKSDIVCGELLMGTDRKLRYPEFLRIPVYRSMVEWIKEHDKKTPVYLCMESKKAWQETLPGAECTEDVEKTLIAMHDG